MSPWRQAVVPAEPDEDGEIEEVEGEGEEQGEPEAEHLQGHELVEVDDEEAAGGFFVLISLRPGTSKRPAFPTLPRSR